MGVWGFFRKARFDSFFGCDGEERGLLEEEFPRPPSLSSFSGVHRGGFLSIDRSSVFLFLSLSAA